MAISPGVASPSADPVPVMWQRVAALAGPAFAVLLVLLIALTGAETPDQNAAPAEWNQFAADNENRIRIGVIVAALAIYEFVIWLGYLRGVLADAEQRVRGFTRMAAWPYAGGVISIAGLGLGVFIAAHSLTFEDAPGEVIRGINHAASAGFDLSMAGNAVLGISTWFCVTATRSLPSWLGWVALAMGLFSLLTFGTFLAEELDNAFGIFYPLAWLAMVIFVVGSSVEFLRRLKPATS